MITLNADLLNDIVGQNLFVVIPCKIAAPQQSLRHNRPTVSLAEHTAVFRITRWKTVDHSRFLCRPPGITRCIQQQPQTSIQFTSSAVHGMKLFFPGTCPRNDHPALGVKPNPPVLCCMGADGFSVIIKPPQEPVTVPGIALQRLFLLFYQSGKTLCCPAVPTHHGKFFQLPQRIDMLLGNKHRLSPALASIRSKMVIPVAEQDQRKSMFAQMLFRKVHSAQQMLPKRCAAGMRNHVRRKERNLPVQETEIPRFCCNGISQVHHPDMIIGPCDILCRTVFLRPHDVNRMSVLKLL